VYAMEVLLAVLGAAALILCLWSFIVCWHDRVTTVRREQEVTASTIHTLITFNPPHNSLSYFPLISSFVGLHFFLLTSKHPRVVQKSKTHATFRLALSLASIRLSKSTPRPPHLFSFLLSIKILSFTFIILPISQLHERLDGMYYVVHKIFN